MSASLQPVPLALPRWLFATLLALIVAAAFLVRVNGGQHVIEPDRFWIWDNDTLRRLVRIERLVDGEHSYPFVEEYDGYPEGSVLHWTLPMDGAILLADACFRPFYPQARLGEAGAVWAGPILSTAAVLLFGLLVRLLFAPLPALLATALYAFSYTAIGVGSFGNGDHQSLQHLALVGALLGHVALLTRRGGTALAIGVGMGLGIALWVSTESQAVLLWMGAASFVRLALAKRGEAALQARVHFVWAITASAIVFVSGWIEHATPFAYAWDQVSALQLHALLIFALFLVAVVRWNDRRGSPPIYVTAAALLALGVGALPWLITPLGSALYDEVENFRAANRWVQAGVTEYRPLFYNFDLFTFSEAVQRFQWSFFALPLLLFGFLRKPTFSFAGRASTTVLFLGCLLLACYEVKLAHFFQVLWPIVVIAGGTWLIQCLPLRTRGWGSFSSAYVVGAALVMIPTALSMPKGQHTLTEQQLLFDHICTALRDADAPSLRPGLEPAVLAPWTLGAHILYYARRGVVASGYHRNLKGIHDSFRAFAAQNSAEIEPILRAHNVRWIVTMPPFAIFHEAQRVLPELGIYAEPVNLSKQDGVLHYDWRTTIDSQTQRARIEGTVLGMLSLSERIADLPQRRVIFETREQIPMPKLGFSVPFARIVELRLSEELRP